MNAPKIACLLSASVMLATTFPAFAQQSGQRGARDRQPQRVLAQQRHYHPVARDAVRRHAYVDRQVFVHRHAGPYAYYGPPAYYWPPYVVRERPMYYYYGEPAYYVSPPYYVGPGPALAAVVPPPPPPPAAKRAPAPERVPAAKRFTLSADALFDLDQWVLKPEGRRQLDKLAADLKDMEYDIVEVTMVKVTGHTDRLGSDSHNMRLSMRRAETVKAHLVNLGLPAAKIVATGKGETNPVTRPGECRGDKPTRELIACLQPDRRVEVEVSVAK
jgi:outer membrane protein OmpA-like peptidoglycan-associated protein